MSINILMDLVIRDETRSIKIKIKYNILLNIFFLKSRIANTPKAVELSAKPAIVGSANSALGLSTPTKMLSYNIYKADNKAIIIIIFDTRIWLYLKYLFAHKIKYIPKIQIIAENNLKEGSTLNIFKSIISYSIAIASINKFFINT